MPWNEDSLGSQSFLCFEDVLGEHLSVVGNLSVHIVDQEWLGEVVFVVGEWHGSEMKSHSGSAINVSEFVHTCGSVTVSVKELSSLGSVLWEIKV